MPKTSEGRVALVTGAGDPHGMGAAVARRFADEGMAVALLDINEEGALATVAMIEASGGRAIAVAADVSDRAQVTAALDQVRTALGPIGVLVNNAAVEGWCPFADITDAQWDKTFDVNAKGAFIVIQGVLPDMEAAGWGRIVNVTALGGQMGGAFDMAHYNASKGALITLTRTLAIGLGVKGITVNAVSPGFIDTPMARRAIDASLFPIDYRDILASYPIPRLGTAQDIAAAVNFLSSEEAGYITGQSLNVNGGCLTS